MTSKLRIIPIGGLGEIGKNMMAIEYEDDILIIDAGIMFPENDMLGVDTIIPDYNYLLDKTDRVRAILVTHGHEDHVGALPHLVKDVKAPIYATKLTAGLIEVKLQRAGLLGDVQINVIEAGDEFEIGPFTIEPFHVAHSIPDCVGFGITTPIGLLVFTGDYKFDHTPVDGWPPDFAKLAEFSQRGVLCLLADSTNADRPGWTQSETRITEAFDKLFREAQGRIIIGTFASLISRIQQVADASLKHGRKLAITGRSMRDNTKMARRLGYLDIPDDMIVELDQAVNMPDHQVTIMATGTQGEPMAVMSRLARGRHRNLSIKKGDTVVFSAHPIPGNEEMVYRVINQILQKGANVLYERIANVHVSGHASQEEMKLMINLVRPQFLIPVHGELRHLKLHGQLGQQLGIPAGNIAVVENGTPIELDGRTMKVLPRLRGGYVFVEGSSVGDVKWPVLRDRERLAQGGVFFAVVPVNSNGDLIGTPEFVTSGFVARDEAREMEDGAQERVVRTVRSFTGSRDQLSKEIEKSLERYLYEETGRRPLIHVVVT
jgi:ribonuclease J